MNSAAEARLTPSAAARLADIDIATTLSNAVALAANERIKDGFHRQTDETRSKFGLVQEAERARHAQLSRLLAGVRQWVAALPHDVELVDVEPVAVEPLAGAALEEALAGIRKAIAEGKMEMHRVSAAALPKADLKRAAKAWAHDLAAKGRPNLELRKGLFTAAFHSERADFDWGNTPAFVAQVMAWFDADRFAQRLADEVDLMPDTFSLSASAKTKRLGELTEELDFSNAEKKP